MWTRRAMLAGGMAAAVLAARPSFAATDQLRVALSGEPPYLDPTAGSDPAALIVAWQNIFEGLTRIDEAGAVQPGLAKSWSVTDDGQTFTFALQEQVNYHDGTSFDAGHVVFALKRLLGQKALDPDRFLAAVTDVSAVDDLTVRIALSRPDGTLLHDLGLPAAAIVAPESADNNRTVPLGTGPFDFVEWDPGQGIVLERNEDYWGAHPRISQVSFLFMPDADAAIAALLARDVDGYPAFPSAEAAGPLRGNPLLRLVDGKGPDGKPMLGVWDARLTGMWANAPVGGCPLAGVSWES